MGVDSNMAQLMPNYFFFGQWVCQTILLVHIFNQTLFLPAWWSILCSLMRCLSCAACILLLPSFSFRLLSPLAFQVEDDTVPPLVNVLSRECYEWRFANGCNRTTWVDRVSEEYLELASSFSGKYFIFSRQGPPAPCSELIVYYICIALCLLT